jgi:hypothetical protein
MHAQSPTRPTILVLQTRGLNAFLAAVPALRAISEEFAACRRMLVARGNLRPLVELIPWPGFEPAFEVVSHPALVPLPRSLEHPSLAINLHGPGPQSNSILRALHPRRLIAYEGPLWSRGPVWEPNASEVARWAALLEHAGIDVDRSRNRLWKPKSAELARGATVIHPGSSDEDRPGAMVPTAAWAELARAEVEAGRNVLITGRKGDAGAATAIAERADLDAGTVLAGRTDLGDLARVVSGAARVVSADGGISPLASALGTPSLTIYHPRFQSRLGVPRGHRHRSVLLDAQTESEAELAAHLRNELARLPVRRFADAQRDGHATAERAATLG